MWQESGWIKDMRISDVLWVVHDEGEVGDEDGLGREEELADCGRHGGGMEQGYRSHTRDPLHLSYGCLKPYIQKAEVLEVRTPQIILIFRKVIVWERENYQICSVEFCQEDQ